MVKALTFGANIEILKLKSIEDSGLDNFSQIFSVPSERSAEFENSIRIYSKNTTEFNLSKLKTWS
jgi:hypothetical protein